MRRLALLVLVAVLACCSRSALLEKVSFPEDRVLAIKALTLVETGNMSGLAAIMPPEATQKLPDALPGIRSGLPATGSSTKLLVDARYVLLTSGEPIRQAYLAYQLEGSGRFALAQLTIEKSGSREVLNSLSVYRINGPAAELNAFDAQRRSWRHYLALFLVFFNVGTTLVAVAKVWRSGLFPRRWLWTLGCLVGVGDLTLNWTAGTFGFTPVFIRLFSVGVLKPGFIAPWTISASLPLIALIVLARGRRGDARRSEDESARA